MSDELRERLARKAEEFLGPLAARELVDTILAEIRAQGKVIVDEYLIRQAFGEGWAEAEDGFQSSSARAWEHSISKKDLLKAAEEKP